MTMHSLIQNLNYSPANFSRVQCECHSKNTDLPLEKREKLHEIFDAGSLTKKTTHISHIRQVCHIL